MAAGNTCPPDARLVPARIYCRGRPEGGCTLQLQPGRIPNLLDAHSPSPQPRRPAPHGTGRRDSGAAFHGRASANEAVRFPPDPDDLHLQAGSGTLAAASPQPVPGPSRAGPGAPPPSALGMTLACDIGPASPPAPPSAARPAPSSGRPAAVWLPTPGGPAVSAPAKTRLLSLVPLTGIPLPEDHYFPFFTVDSLLTVLTQFSYT